MPLPEFNQDYFTLFGLPRQFELEQSALGERYRALQQDLHPDRFAGASDHERRVALQYSSWVNEAYTSLRNPLARALYLLELAGLDQQQVSSQQVDGGFLIEQMELREKLETLEDLVDPDSVLEHLMAEIAGDISAHQKEFVTAYDADNLTGAAAACVKMQYLEKLLEEAEQLESAWLDR